MDNFCGKRLDGRYEIREIIGVGGMAVVYKAYDNIDDRVVAIKILKDEYLTNEEFKRRFKNESKAIAVLSHPNIVRVYNVSFGDRLQYIVMEYVDGITLKEYIEQQGVINWKEAVHFIGQILAALQHAHDKGIVHQDIKPQNIMLLQDGTIKVTDFGIARFSRSDYHTITDKAIGSVHYISPEQARGEITDEKADIYSIGVVLYEMLTGQLPFQSDSVVSVALMQLQQEPVRPREIIPTIPLGLEQVTIRAMQKTPQSRYRSAAEMLMDINEFKRNPSIKFNYSYFVDQEPTKYIRTNNNNDTLVRDTRHFNVEKQEDHDDDQSSNKTSAVLIGAIAGLLVVAAVIVGIFVGNKNKKIDVPNFIGKNFLSEVKGNEEYEDFEFVTEYTEDPNKENGVITGQNPDPDSKVKKNSKIKLTIVNNVDMTLIDKSVIGMSKENATKWFTSNNLKAKYETIYDISVKPGCVVRTSPEAGTYVKSGETVIVYIATDKETQVVVPDLIGSDQDAAKAALEAVGLKLGTVTEVNSNLEKGMICFQTFAAGSNVFAGSIIDVEVSNGIPTETTVDIVVKLPNTNKPGKLKIYLNSEIVYESKELFMDGKTQTIQITGSGSENEYTVTIDDSPIQKGKIDFSQMPAVIVDMEEIVVLVNVVGNDKSAAEAKLKAAGFTNIKIVEKPSSTYSAGTVISQTPTADGTSRISTKTEIVLEVSTGPSA